MPSEESQNTAPPEDAPSPQTCDQEDLFESALLELFDRYDLPPERIAWLCLYWADEIFTKLGQDTIEKLNRKREFMGEVDAMTSSSIQLVNDLKPGPSVRTTACISQRQLMGFRDWSRLEEHVATLKVEPCRTSVDEARDD